VSESPVSARMSQDEIRLRISELGDWFHNLNIQGVQTAPNHFLGDYPSFKWQRFQAAIPEDLTGKTVLDIGCNAGFYSIEMKRRGAERVVAIDSDPAYLTQAGFASKMSGTPIELRLMDVYSVAQLKEKFDIVLFMGVLYHLRHPLLALDLLHQYVVKEMLVFQSLQRGNRETCHIEKDYPFTETEIFDKAGYPVMHFVEHSYSNDPTNWWIPNRACAEAMLRSSGFEIVDNPEEEVYICRPKRKTHD
jgi:tRNA (mo5U34)-methyltransferase